MTRYCSGVSSARHSASVFSIFRFVSIELSKFQLGSPLISTDPPTPRPTPPPAPPTHRPTNLASCLVVDFLSRHPFAHQSERDTEGNIEGGHQRRRRDH